LIDLNDWINAYILCKKATFKIVWPTIYKKIARLINNQIYFKMKNLFKNLTILTVFFSIISCSDEKTSNEDSFAEHFKYSKNLKFDDGNGHNLSISIWGDNLDEVNSLSQQDFIFKVFNTAEYTNNAVRIQAKESKSNERKPVNTGKIFINIDEHNITQSGIGFVFKVKKESLESRSFKYYAYGATGVRGAESYFFSGSCNSEYDLEKLNTGSSWFYTGLAEWELNNGGDYGGFCSSTLRYKYRMEFDYSNSCTPDDDFAWWWLSC
jgi:hypothetical protein